MLPGDDFLPGGALEGFLRRKSRREACQADRLEMSSFRSNLQKGPAGKTLDLPGVVVINVVQVHLVPA
jgi:hypothetical protein